MYIARIGVAFFAVAIFCSIFVRIVSGDDGLYTAALLRTRSVHN
jgi:hypothetical protein